MPVSDLPPPVAAFIAATNGFDLDARMATFAADAVVNDRRSEFRGWDAIRDWAAREIIGDRVTMQVIDATRRGESAAVVAMVDGNFDKAGLPDPLALDFYFAVDVGRIVQLVIVRNKPS
jgi:hypothetical protein